jgi:hypothetical protein
MRVWYLGGVMIEGLGNMEDSPLMEYLKAIFGNAITAQ